MTEQQLIAMALEVSGRTEQQLPRFRILALVNEALELLAKRIMGQPGFRAGQKDFTATPTLGRLDLDTLPTILFDVNLAEVRVAASNQGITMIDSVKTLEFGKLPEDQVFCARDGNELVFKQAGGGINQYAQPVKIKTNQIWTLDNLKPQYNGALANIVAELALQAAPLPELTGVST